MLNLLIKKNKLIIISFGVILFFLFFICGSDLGTSTVTPNNGDDDDETITLDSVTLGLFQGDGGLSGSDPCKDTVSYQLSFTTTPKTTGFFYWGTSSSNFSDTVEFTTLENTHQAILNNILVDQAYYYKIKVYSENKTDSLITDIDNFTFDRGTIGAPTFDRIQIVPYPTTAYLYAKISHPANYKIYYGLTANYSDSVVSSQSASLIYEKLDNLSPDTMYHYTLYLEDNCGNISASGWDSTFSTPPLPEIYFVPDTVDVDVGDTAEIAVYIKNIKNVFAISQQFTFPKNNIIFNGLSKGALSYNSDYHPIQFVQNPFNVNSNIVGSTSTWEIIIENNIYLGTYLQLEENQPGHVATFYFTVTRSTNSPIEFIVTESFCLDHQMDSIDMVTYNGYINAQ